MDHSPPTPLGRRPVIAVVAGLPVPALLALALAVVLPSGVAAAGTVTVQPGQSLSQVAAAEGTTVGALAAANGIGNPNQVDAGTVLQVPGPATTTPAVTAVTVEEGQTLSGIAAQYGTTAGALAAANGISDPDLVAAGAVLHLPAAGGSAPAAESPDTSFTTVEVQPGETFSALASRFATTIAALAAANGITNPNVVEAGTVLQLPHPATTPATGATPAAVTTVGNVTVRPGDTLTSLAARYGTTPAALAAANGITNPNVVFAGMQLKLPAEAVAGGSATVPVATGAYPTALVDAPDRLALQPDFVHAASASGVPLSLLEALCWWESGWQTTAVSATGAIGVCQILPSTAAFVSSSILQVPPSTRVAAQNIDLAAAYLRYLLNTTGGNAGQALAGYSQGLASIAHEGVTPATKTYVTGILAYAAIFAGQG